MSEGTTEYKMGLDHVRECWKRAASFPTDKEIVYPEHAIAQEFDAHRGKRILEYGCGGGSDTLSYLRRMCRVTFVDIVASNVNATRQRVIDAGLTARAQGISLGDSDRIPLGSGIFDVASAHGVLHHIPDPLPVLAELRRLLKPRGLLYVMLYTETLYDHLRENTKRLADSGLSVEEAFGWGTDGEGCPYSVPYTDAEARILLARAGFDPHPDAVEYNRGEFRTYKAIAP